MSQLWVFMNLLDFVCVPVDVRTKSKLQCTVERGNLDSVLTVPDDDPIPRWTRTKVRIVCLLLNEELPLKKQKGLEIPHPHCWEIRSPGAGAQAISNEGNSGELVTFSRVRISFVKWRNWIGWCYFPMTDPFAKKKRAFLNNWQLRKQRFIIIKIEIQRQTKEQHYNI